MLPVDPRLGTRHRGYRTPQLNSHGLLECFKTIICTHTLSTGDLHTTTVGVYELRPQPAVLMGSFEEPERFAHRTWVARGS